jgi:ATP sulfurylase
MIKKLKIYGKKIKILCTLGPASLNKETIVKLDNLGVDLFRINLSHTSVEKIESVISEIKKHTSKPICLDTEGAQIRIGLVKNGKIYLKENSLVEIARNEIESTEEKIYLSPSFALDQIVPGDLISIDFDTVLLLAVQHNKNMLIAKVISPGWVGSNKAVSVDRDIDLPSMSEKDKMAIDIGLKYGISHYALSFADSKASVEEFRHRAGEGAHIICKIESKKGVRNLDEILDVADAILIDRGDLSREESVEKIPFMQKMIIKKANQKNIPAYVATNLLESMVTSKNPTRAEVNDIVNTLLDGANGLVLAAETAIGKYPTHCVTMVSKIIKHFSAISGIRCLGELQNYDSFLLVEPHGQFLVNRFLTSYDAKQTKKIKRLSVDKTTLMDAEQIAIGTFSPLEGFMKKAELDSVLHEYKLPNGTVWPLPIVFQAKKDDLKGIHAGDQVALNLRGTDDVYAILHVEELYQYNLKTFLTMMFGTDDSKHPGVRLLRKRGDYFVGGKIDLIKRLSSEYKHYELTPRQARSIFERNGWSRVVGFHTRNVIHRVHEHIQMEAIGRYQCDGLFVHPVTGPKKKGDFTEAAILKSYELMENEFYPKEKVVLGAFQNYSRYAGPREAVFTALCRKNFGCTHFIVGRDHTGVKDYYGPYDVHQLFERLGDIGIVPVFFKEMNYCKRCKEYVEECKHGDAQILKISGSKCREILKTNQRPPEWYMRRKISDFVLSSIKKGENVFVL